MKSLNNFVFTLTSLGILLFSHSIYAQPKESELKKGNKVSVTIMPGEKHRYKVKMDANYFAFFRLIQDEVDAIITTYDPDGNKIEDFDSPNGRYGEETVSIFSTKKGIYIVEVRNLEEKEPKGCYDLIFEKLESIGSTPPKIIDQLFETWKSLKTPGSSVAVTRDGKIVFAKGYGSADLENDIPIIQSTVFNIASVSKQITAFAILLLEKDGKLTIDDDIRKFVPEVPDFGYKITLRHLMTHTSGLREQAGLLTMAGWRLDDVITMDHVLRLVSQQKELNFNPGNEFEYCNTGYSLLAEVVARVSGQSFAEYTRKNIFEPLKMNNTLFCDDYEKIVKKRAYSFRQDSTGYKKCILNDVVVGSSSLLSTAEDLCLWAMNFEKPVVGNTEIINIMNQPAVLNNGQILPYAFGQFYGKYKNLNFFAHSGSDGGYRAYFLRFPDQKFSVAVLSNYDSFNPSDLAYKLTDVYLKDQLRSDTQEKGSADSNEVVTKSVEVSSEILKTYCGQYEFQPGFVAIISYENDKLFMEAPGNRKIQLTPYSPAEFIVLGAPVKITFYKDENGKPIKLGINQRGNESFAARLPDFDPARVDLTEFTGDFYSRELSSTYSLNVRSGKLIASHFRTGDIVLIPVMTDNFSTDKWWFNQIEFVRDESKKITGLKVSDVGVRNLRFEKVVGKASDLANSWP